MVPIRRDTNMHAGTAVILNSSSSVNIFRTYTAAVQTRQTPANSPLALKKRLSSEIFATGMSQNSVSFFEVAHLADEAEASFLYA